MENLADRTDVLERAAFAAEKEFGVLTPLRRRALTARCILQAEQDLGYPLNAHTRQDTAHAVLAAEEAIQQSTAAKRWARFACALSALACALILLK
jgi:hypothetical protein